MAGSGCPTSTPVCGCDMFTGSRSVVVDKNIHVLWSNPVWRGLDGSSQFPNLLEQTLREVDMDVLVLPATWAAPADHTSLWRTALVVTPEGKDLG